MAGKLVIPNRAFNDKVVVGFLNRILSSINAVLPATTTDAGIVFRAFASADSAGTGVTVTSPNATDLATNNTLTNELKTDVNQLAADLDALAVTVNDLKAKMRLAGQLDL